MQVKCPINRNTNQNGFLLPTKCAEKVLKYTCLVSIIFNSLIYDCGFLESSLRVQLF